MAGKKKYQREKLIIKLQDLIDSGKVKNTSDLGGSFYNTLRTYIAPTWSEILKAADRDLEHINIKKESEIIKELQELVDSGINGIMEVKKVLSRERILVRLNCKNMKEVFKKIGREKEAEHLFLVEKTKEEVTKDIQKLVLEGTIRTIYDLNKYDYSYRRLKKIFGDITWRQMAKEMKLDLHFKAEVDVTNEELIDIYKELSRDLDKDIKGATARDINENCIYNRGCFELRFGSIDNLREICGYEFKKRKGKWTKEIVLETLIKEYKRRNGRLTVNDLKGIKTLPSQGTICKKFKVTNFTEVLKIIEIEINKELFSK